MAIDMGLVDHNNRTAFNKIYPYQLEIKIGFYARVTYIIRTRLGVLNSGYGMFYLDEYRVVYGFKQANDATAFKIALPAGVIADV